MNMDLAALAGKASCGEQFSHSHYVSSRCIYYHYLCDGTDDRGWGCGYRSLQSLCSWVITKKELTGVTPPSLRHIQEALVEVGDKPQSFTGSRDWIGCFESCVVLDHLYKVPSKIIHVSSGSEVKEHVKSLYEHFETVGSPVMIGGDVDSASKTLIGVHVSLDPGHPENTLVLIADPHYHGTPDVDKVLSEGFVKWHSLELFQNTSFYNFCLPQIPTSTLS